MSFVLTRFKESITINKQFAESLAIELRSNNPTSGTILLVANEILLDPSYEFKYNNADVGFPGRYDLTLVADRIKPTAERGKIDLTGSLGRVGTDGTSGANAPNTQDEPNTPGESGEHGGNGGDGGRGFGGMNIKIFCGQLTDIEIISNGGVGGTGGTGGRGGNGGMNTNHGTRGAGGGGGRGGTGGNGGNGGKIEVFCEGLVSIGIISNGGVGGRGGTGGNGGALAAPVISVGGTGGNGGNGGNGGKIEVSFHKDPIGIFNPSSFGGGRGSPGDPGINALGVKGHNGSAGNPGIRSNHNVDNITLRQLWEKVIIELGIPSG